MTLDDTSVPRVEPLSVEDARAIGKEAGVPSSMSGLNVFRTLLRHPTLAGVVAGQLSMLLWKGNKLDPRLRELVIMRVAILNGAPYEADQHAPIALKEGMTQAQLDALPAWQDSALFDDTERAVLAYTDAMTRNIQVDAPVFEAIRERFPNQMLAYNCSPSFNWQRKLDAATIAAFQRELGAMGYKFQFVTLAGFHALNLSMFELARGYKESGMAAYSALQQREFEHESEFGYRATKHQRFVGTGYFDQVAQAIAGGKASTTALSGSTEEEQFEPELLPA